MENIPVGKYAKNCDTVDLPKDWTLSERQMCDLEMLLSGAFSPLKGFMCQNDYESVLHNMTLSNGEVFPLPVVLAIPKKCCEKGVSNVHWDNTQSMENVETLDNVMVLRDPVGAIIAKLKVESVYIPNLEEEMEKSLGTKDSNHPYVKYLMENHAECIYIGGSVEAQNDGIVHFNFQKYRHTPKECHKMIRENGYEVVVGFQTRNPIHRCHYELIKQSLFKAATMENQKPLLFLSPVVGPTQKEDIPYYLRVWCYEHVVDYFNSDLECQFKDYCKTSSSTPTQEAKSALTNEAAFKDNCMLVLIPLAMRMAGPRECVLHALIRKNYGCTHFIVGRDHAGPSSRKQDGTSFYGPYDAHALLNSVADKINIVPLLGQEMVYVGQEHGGYVSANQYQEIKKQNNNVQVATISGTEFRNMLVKRQDIPEWFSFKPVVAELQRVYKPNYMRGVCLYFTGLPCSGKSTLANAVSAALLQNRCEDRQITILDADIVRQHLSKGLGFSREDRSTNVRRIGYLASEIVKHGGICLVANIAPYNTDRKYNRSLIEESGGAYIEVYVSTPLSVCEGRDIKNLYKKARQGIIKQFTGISDPYETPFDAELTIDSSNQIENKVDVILKYLESNKFIIYK